MMLKLCALKRRALLLTKTNLSPKFANDTRWSSTFEMLKRYFKIIEPVKELFANDMQVDRVADDVPPEHYSRIKMYKLIPTPEEHDELLKLSTILKPFEDTTSSLQGEIIQLIVRQKCGPSYGTLIFQ
jgi:hypothetical protein